MDPGEQCDVGFEYGGLNSSAPGCDAATCTGAKFSFVLVYPPPLPIAILAVRPNWACHQIGSPDLPAVTPALFPGEVAIPGPGQTFLLDANGYPLFWGVAPARMNVSCRCANDAGTYANESVADCAAAPCPYPARCVAVGKRNNGTACVGGSEGVGCAQCSVRWYRYGLECRPCPTGIPVTLVLLAGA